MQKPGQTWDPNNALDWLNITNRNVVAPELNVNDYSNAIPGTSAVVNAYPGSDAWDKVWLPDQPDNLTGLLDKYESANRTSATVAADIDVVYLWNSRDRARDTTRMTCTVAQSLRNRQDTESVTDTPVFNVTPGMDDLRISGIACDEMGNEVSGPRFLLHVPTTQRHIIAAHMQPSLEKLGFLFSVRVSFKPSIAFLSLTLSSLSLPLLLCFNLLPYRMVKRDCFCAQLWRALLHKGSSFALSSSPSFGWFSRCLLLALQRDAILYLTLLPYEKEQDDENGMLQSYHSKTRMSNEDGRAQLPMRFSSGQLTVLSAANQSTARINVVGQGQYWHDGMATVLVTAVGTARLVTAKVNLKLQTCWAGYRHVTRSGL